MSIRLTMIVRLTGILDTEEISIDRIEPSRIQMSVTYHMDIDDIVAKFRTVLERKKKNVCHPTSSISRRSVPYTHSCWRLMIRRFPPGLWIRACERSAPRVEWYVFRRHVVVFAVDLFSRHVVHKRIGQVKLSRSWR
jgi:hypothetical protein